MISTRIKRRTMAQKIERVVLAQRIREVEGLSDEERSALLKLLNTKYGLVWEEKSEEVEERLRESLPVLDEDKELALLDGGEEAPNHIIIEGDNLEALNALSYTHEGKVDVIYIDPPYNTGNKDFVYNDSFVDSEDSYRHSKWLSFMSKRLRIAKRLLSDKGVIFISIDDNEQANLKLLCDEILGCYNFLAFFIWKKRQMVDSRTKTGVSKDHDYLLCYRKTEDGRIKGKLTDMKKYSNPDNDPRGAWMSADMTGLATELQRPNLHYDLTNPTTNITYKCPPTGWRYEKNRMATLISNNEIIWPTKSTGRPRRKKFARDLESEFTGLSTVLETVYSTQGTREVRDIFEGEELFDFPKPVDYIKLILNQGIQNSTILDFFAGSGTTLHATMQLNAEDGGKRRCILVTNNENNICREVTYERNKRVIEGYVTPKGVKVEGLKGNNLRYYRTELLPRERTMRNMRRLMGCCTELLCVKEDLYKEKRRFGNMELKPGVARYFEEGRKRMLVIYREEVIFDIVKELEGMELEEKIKVYVFSPGRYAFDDDFETVEEKVQLCALPAAIYEAYNKVLPKKKRSMETELTEPNPTNMEEEA